MTQATFAQISRRILTLLTTRPSSTAAVWCQRCLSSGAGEPAGKLKAAATDLPPLALTPPTEPGPEDCCQVQFGNATDLSGQRINVDCFMCQIGAGQLHCSESNSASAENLRISNSTSWVLQTGCVECVWDVYQRELHAYNLQQAKLKGEAPPLDPFEEMERRLFGK